ncbi:hypothetical protein BDV27DRAFT_120627 [Aspergillus caelatus]|uniref:Uncharacterized protein n=1 Tax=Aspergillus caelatus TaxID=61420 RepID=A0A5N7AKB9_9EURO|nr:uncharacterized protein BDV27DRAFT_120627 [Aspergillus caelatus]KAE8369646.1 hypothetical protein BDV27DRAFT_120627 [Aspergillus caelatus]
MHSSTLLPLTQLPSSLPLGSTAPKTQPSYCDPVKGTTYYGVNTKCSVAMARKAPASLVGSRRSNVTMSSPYVKDVNIVA